MDPGIGGLGGGPIVAFPLFQRRGLVVGGTGTAPVGGITNGSEVMPRTRVGSALDVGGAAGGLTIEACEALGIPASICALGGAAVAEFFAPDEEPTQQLPLQAPEAGFQTSCPPGFVLNNQGVCQALPGMNGQQANGFTPATGAGQPVRGMFGVGVRPRQVGRITSRQGVNRPILRCPTKHVLGEDNVCYRHLPNTKRKWPKGRKPLLTGGEMNAITKAERAARRLQRTKKKLRTASRALGKVC